MTVYGTVRFAVFGHPAVAELTSKGGSAGYPASL